MNLLQALVYFVREALVGLLRSWRVSVLAVLTIGVSLFLAGSLLLTSGNLARAVDGWRREARLAVYLAEGISSEARERIASELRSAPWVESLEYISAERGATRFRSAFPSLAELVEDARYGSLPAAFEVRQRELAADESGDHERWLARIAAFPGVETVDDDREWIEDVATLLLVVRALGSALTGVLLGAAIFTIAAVVRLTSFLYRDEIAIMRLVGATEFFIRGPFYLEGLLQGLAGGVVSMVALRVAHVAMTPRLEGSLVLRLIASEFLAPGETVALILIGATAGLGGALVSLGREQSASERS